MFSINKSGQGYKRRVVAHPADISAISELIFDQGKSILISLEDDGMRPFIRPEVDQVEIHRVALREIRVSDLVFIKLGGRFNIRRVYEIDGEEVYMIGDADVRPEGPYPIHAIVGIATDIYRKGKPIPCTSPSMRSLVRFWGSLRPLRLWMRGARLKFPSLSISQMTAKTQTSVNPES